MERVFHYLAGTFVCLFLLGGVGFICLIGCEKYKQVFPNYTVRVDNTPPPNYVIIKGERWYIDGVKGLENDGIYGETMCERKYILYDSRLTNPLLRETVWHEVNHAVLCNPKARENANWRKAIDGEEHDVVYPLSMGQISFMHDNPDFMQWMGNW